MLQDSFEVSEWSQVVFYHSVCIQHHICVWACILQLLIYSCSAQPHSPCTAHFGCKIQRSDQSIDSGNVDTVKTHWQNHSRSRFFFTKKSKNHSRSRTIFTKTIQIKKKNLEREWFCQFSVKKNLEREWFFTLFFSVAGRCCVHVRCLVDFGQPRCVD